MTAPTLGPAAQARVLIPFVVVTLIWSTTWIVIRGQLGVVPPGWSVSYRFAVAAIAMFGWALTQRERIGIDRAGHGFAVLFGLFQFVLNFNWVYRAEGFVTSGLVAVTFALLVVPNALFGWLWLGQPLSRRFLAGSAVGMLGVGLLFAHELNVGAAGRSATLLGIGYTMLGVVSASIANVMQATERARRYPMTVLLGWGMFYGALLDAALAWTTTGAPVIEWRAGYLFGIGYLGVIASAVAFSFYFRLVRAIGPGRAAYTSVLTPILAMAISTVFEHYRWSPLAAFGSALALAGLVVALRARSPAR